MPQDSSNEEAGMKNKHKSSRSDAKKRKKDKKNGSKDQQPVAAAAAGLDIYENYDANKVPKTRNVAEELKLFQNSNLLNQQDPMEHLHQQLNRLILDDANTGEGARHQDGNRADKGDQLKLLDKPANNTGLSSMQSALQNGMEAVDFHTSANMFTIKKGVLWQQQDNDKFHQRLFNRWKKRFFILTTDYLVCFKKSTSKVGRSAMGKFLYKTSLGDILELEWSRPNKSDKGAIILRMKNHFRLFLWSRENLDEWMALIDSMRAKRMLRGCQRESAHLEASLANQNGIYENAPLPGGPNGLISNQTPQDEVNHELRGDLLLKAQVMESTLTSSSQNGLKQTKASSQVAQHSNQSLAELGLPNGEILRPTHNNLCSNSVANHVGSDVKAESGPVRANMINDDGKTAEEETSRDYAQGSSPNGLVIPPNKAKAQNKVPRDQSIHSTASSSVERQEVGVTDSTADSSLDRAKEVSGKDSNDNIVLSATESKTIDMIERQTSVRDRKARDGSRTKPDASDKLRNRQSHDLPDVVSMSKQLHLQRTDEKLQARRPPVEAERSVSNLIRRDDSWHSSLSLNQVGINHMQAAKRALYAQNMTQSAAGPPHELGQTELENFQRHSKMNSIDATATPMRGRMPLRQQSMQLNGQRRLPLIRQHQQANSFDVAQIPNSPSQNHHQLPPTSYHQKLLQLQLLHNSNNIDYVRNNGESNGYRAGNDNQIYGPGSVATTNHYGYYSMRSNLKSAASEFSFIRPNSSDFYTNDLAQRQASLENGQSNLRHNLSQHSNHQPAITQPSDHQNHLPTSNRNLPFELNHYLNQNGTDNRAVNDPGMIIHEANLSMAPNRELPLKPNKKRQQITGNETNLQKGSSKNLGSSIVHFFRRAFSKRSKSRPRMVESCSSSMGGALDEKFESIQRTRSAFSTTEGARAERIHAESEQQSLIKQRHQMINLIDAYANATAADPAEVNARLSQKNHIQSTNHLSALQHLTTAQRGDGCMQAPYLTRQFISSPLHKSNSISTSTGLRGLTELMRINERQALLNSQHNHPANAPGHGLNSPVVTRSTKVMSANLTPSFGGKATHDFEERSFASPSRGPSKLEHAPRPSSIYGQPSLTSAPLNLNTQQELRYGEFGSHRSSIHSYHLRTDGSNRVPSIEPRRNHHHNKKTPILDTTREVAEEISSPTTESREFINLENRNDFRSSANPTPMKYSVKQPRRAIVNPILQSPTMNMIYDNHPTPNANDGATSHYDNHRPLEYLQSMSSMDLSAHSNHQSFSSDLLANNRLSDRINNDGGRREFSSPLAAAHHRITSRQFDVSNHNNGPLTPSHFTERYQQQSNMDGYPPEVTILTPVNQRALGSSYSTQVTHTPPPVGNQFDLYAQAKSRTAMMKPSPVKTPIQRASSHYQQSPLVDRQARIVMRGDGVQATSIQSRFSDVDAYAKHEAVVNIVGAPGVNLEPSLAQSLLRGTNIDAFETPVVGLHQNSSQSNPHTKTFLVSSRLSRTITEPSSDSKRNQSTFGRLEKKNREQTREEDQSSRSTTSGTDVTSTSSSAKSNSSGKRRGTNDYSMRSEQADNRLVIEKESKDKPNSANHSDKGRRRGSSTEHSDELSSQTDISEEPPEGRKWITSKLVQGDPC